MFLSPSTFFLVLMFTMTFWNKVLSSDPKDLQQPKKPCLAGFYLEIPTLDSPLLRLQPYMHQFLLQSCEETLNKFWTLEEPPKPKLSQSPTDKLVVQDFDRSHRRDETDRFVAKLPFKPQGPPWENHDPWHCGGFCPLNVVFSALIICKIIQRSWMRTSH